VKATKKVTRKPKGTALAVKETGLPEKAAKGVREIVPVGPGELLSQAIAKGLPMDTIERLVALFDRQVAKQARDDFFTALSGFQRECPIVVKKHQVRDRDKVTKADKGLRYAYAAIEDMTEQAGPYLDKFGFSWTCKPKQTDGHVKAIVYAHHKDGHEEATEFEVPLDPDAYMSDPQKAAAALTFATRYAFKAAFGIQTKGEDNDAQRGEEEPRRREPIQTPQARSAEPAVPVAHEEVRPPATDYERILYYLKGTATDPKSKALVKLFSENEIIDYTHEATENKGNPEALKKTLTDIVETGKKRTHAVKGEA
jgi:hypothetical protein